MHFWVIFSQMDNAPNLSSSVVFQTWMMIFAAINIET
jgi:hypothetical protein